ARRARRAARRLVLAAGGAAARRAALPPAPPPAGARALSHFRQPRLLALPDPRERVRDRRAVAADGDRRAGAYGGRRSGRAAGRIGLDADRRRARRQPLAAIDALPARARRIARLARRSHGDGA